MGGLLPRPPVRRSRDGSFELRIGEEEQAVLRDVLEQVRTLLVQDDPLLRRLFPTAYADDAERDAGYRALTHDDLLASRLAALDLMEETLGRDRLDQEELDRWMHAVNAIRLVLGTRLDISEETDFRTVDLDDPDAGLLGLYEYLTWLLSFIVDAQSEALGPGG